MSEKEDKQSQTRSDERTDIESQFYVFLKDAQPIAFLASFSIVIAVFAFPNNKFSSIFEFAANASAMFLISFIVSIIGRTAVYREDQEKTSRGIYTQLTRYGTFFFFGMGVLYLVFILLEFAKTVTSISQITSGWIPLLAGILLFASARKRIKEDLKKAKPLRKITTCMIMGLIIISLIHGVYPIVKAVTKTEFVLFPFTVFALIMMIFVVVTLVLAMITNKIEKGSITDPSYKESTPNLMSGIAMLIFAIAIIIPIFTTINPNTECDYTCKTTFEKLGFQCMIETDNHYSCRFISEKATTITIPDNVSSLPNEKNFEPDDVTVSIEVNNVIRWVNSDKISHKITSDDGEFVLKEIKSDETFVYRFTTEGTYHYHSDLPWLKGKITVKNLDDQYQSGIPLEQISDKNNIFYKIFRESDRFGYVTNSSISSPTSIWVSLTNQTEPKLLEIGDTIIGNCQKNDENSIVTYLKLTEIKKQLVPYAIFKETQKNDTMRSCN